MLSDRIGKIEKARQYATQSERFRVVGEHVHVRGDHGSYVLTRGSEDVDWACSCDYCRRNGWCAHTLAFEWYSGQRPSVSVS
jgi:hypothetical protein